MAATNFPCDKDCLQILAEKKEKQRQEEKARSEEEERLRQVGALCYKVLLVEMSCISISICYTTLKCDA